MGAGDNPSHRRALGSSQSRITMCGITGVVSFDAPPDGEHLRAMLDSQVHRGPDDYGVWTSKDRACVLGNNRLSVIDLSPAGHQPMVDESTGNTIVFNGEIFNFQLLRQQLEDEGERFRSQTDTEVILALYRRRGVDCVKALRGMFAFAIWDAQAQHLYIARDRMGEKPFNYSLTNNQIIFGSEIQALAKHPLVPGDEDPEALELYLQLQYIPAPWTIYQSIRKFPPAHYAVFDRKGLHVTRYWQLSYQQDRNMSARDALEGLEEKLTDAVKVRLVADVPIGTTLSGGVDSSLVTAIMAKLNTLPIKTYHVSLRESGFDESPYAQMVADTCGTDHHTRVLEPDIQELLPTIVHHYGEPYADKGGIPAFFISKAAREEVTVALNGDGGDELLGGYPMYRLPRIAQILAGKAWNPTGIDALAARVPSLQHDSGLLNKVQRRLVTTLKNPELRPLFYAAFWDDARRGELLESHQAHRGAVHGWRRSMLEGAGANADHPINRMLWIQNNSYLPWDGLVKLDIASMHCSLEMRTPLVDHELVEYCASLPAELKVKGQVPKYPLKAIAEQYLPRELLYRKKQGFSIPVAQWLRGTLRPMMEDVLTNKEFMEPFRIPVVKQMMVEFGAGASRHESRLWALFMYGLWRQETKKS